MDASEMAGRRRRSHIQGSEDGDGATRPSRRGRSQIHGSEDGDGAIRPSHRRRSQIHGSEDDDGAIRPSRRRRSQIHGSEDGDGATRPSRRRRRPQIHGSVDGDGATRPSRRRRRPQIHGSEDGDGATRPSRRRRRATSPEVPDDADTLWESLPLDMLWEILLLLPPKPSSRFCASRVSTLWRGIATDPNFVSQFRAHRRPPLLGFFVCRGGKLEFNQGFLHPLDRIPAQDFSVPSSYEIRGCRHGRVLAVDHDDAKLGVFAPLTGEVCDLSVPCQFKPPKCFYLNGAVLCAADDHGHVHGMCHLSPFKVVLLSQYSRVDRFITSVYSSITKKWSAVAWKEAPCCVDSDVPATLVNNRLYWLLSSKVRGLLEFDLDRQSLTVIEGPTGMINSGSHWIIKTEHGTVSWVMFSFPTLKLWEMKMDCHGFSTWLDPNIVDMHNVLGIPPKIGRKVWHSKLRGYDEANNVIILYVEDSAYMVDLNSMKSTKVDGNRSMNRCHPFTSFYPTEMAI